MLYNFDNFIRRRLTDHNKITFAIKGNDVISHVTIAELGFFVAVTRFHQRVKNK